MKKLALFGLIVAGSAFFQMVEAAEIQNLQVIRNESDLYISWDPLSSDDLSGQSGYAVTWGEFQSQMRIDEYAKQYLGNVTNLSIRGADFKRNNVYYFRVFSYSEGGREKPLKNGSKILKWKETDFGIYDTDLIEANDPVIISTNSSSGGTVSYDFGSVRVLELDTFVDISWSAHTKMAKSDYDGFTIEISTDTNFNNIIGKLETERGKIRARILGLTPETDYYVRGSFHKNGTRFGTGEEKKFSTIRAIPRDASSVASRNILKIERRKYLELDLGDGSTTSTTTSSSSSSNSTSSSSTSTSSSSSTSVSSSASNTEISARIKEIESQISALNSELIRLKARLRSNGGTVTASNRSRVTSSRSTSSVRTPAKTSIRERLAARLAKLRSKSR